MEKLFGKAKKIVKNFMVWLRTKVPLAAMDWSEEPLKNWAEK